VGADKPKVSAATLVSTTGEAGTLTGGGRCEVEGTRSRLAFTALAQAARGTIRG
jgi:hypothetical protein